MAPRAEPGRPGCGRRLRLARALTSAACASLWLAVSAPAQQPPPPPDSLAVAVPADTPLAPPRVALVLSGGGSRGLAHAGVLVGLQRLGYDPDVVVGTSMGALVGALYAAGYPPEEIQRQIDAVDWGEMFTPAPLLLGPDRTVRYPLVTLDWESDPLRFSRGFIPQWRINRALARLLFDANARARGDFDRLARRFRAVAADLQSGAAVVLSEGDLARATRASMAVPAVFAPVDWEGRPLIDGGIADNLPVTPARALGATHVIGVDVSRPPEEIQGRKPLQVLGRALDLLQENAEIDDDPPDEMVLPDIPPNFTGVTFPSDPTPLFQLGLAAALRDLRPAGTPAPVARPLPAAPRTLGELRVEAPDPALTALARRALAVAAPGPYDPDVVLRAVDRLYATGLLEAVWPRVEETGEGLPPALVVRLEAPPKTSAAGALGYDTDRGGRAWGAVQRSAVLLRAPASVTLGGSVDRLEQTGSLSARLFLPPSPFVVWSGGLHLRETDVRRFGHETQVSGQEVLRAGGWLGVELQHALAARMAAGLVRAEWIGVEEGKEGFSVGPLLRVEGQAPELPVVGTPLEAEAEVRWGSIAYRRVAARGSRGLRLGNARVAAVGDFAATSRDAPPDALPALGDQHAVPGLRWGEQRAPVRAVAGLDAAYPLPVQGFARARFRLAASTGQVADLASTAPWFGALELGALWRTPFGSLTVGWGFSARGDRNFVLNLGPQF